ncbi:MAG: PHP domain-containing protein, partial [Acidobacteria bacterium]|nr:PHP domain-containing protein [Acidobacteriota bacterium]
MRRLAPAALLVAGALWLIVPPAARRAGPEDHAPLPGRAPVVVRGALHVHSVWSDGSGTVPEIAAAAHRAGLDFVVLTDHGDGTRPPAPPAYRSGVLCLDGVEISTDGGHYMALGLPQAPYPLGGDAAGVVEDVARLGGFGIVAHPASPKPELAWR